MSSESWFIYNTLAKLFIEALLQMSVKSTLKKKLTSVKYKKGSTDNFIYLTFNIHTFSC